MAEPTSPHRASEADQLTLRLWRDGAYSFEGYEPGPNAEVLHWLTQRPPADTQNVFLFGAAASGKSHLLLAACGASLGDGHAAAYVDLAQWVRDTDPAALLGLERAELICLDHVDAIAGNASWAIGLFNLHEAAAERGVPLLFAARHRPTELGTGLPDLDSRLSRALSFALKPLADEDLAAALARKARLRGFDLPQPSLEFLLARLPRDMAALSAALDRLDVHTLARQRRVTVPAIKEALKL